MSASGCNEFRGALERHLRGRPLPEELSSLSWDAHLLSCAECRALLEAEEALEVLLASLPEPSLPAELAERVLARLARAADERDALLDELLDRDDAPAVPAGLAERVLAGVAHARARDLDALLDELPAPEIPAGLSDRTLAALSAERRGVGPRVRLRLVPRRLAAAAGILATALAGLAVWRELWPGDPAGSQVVFDDVPVELLADLELFADDWELLMADDLDAFLGTLPEGERLWLSASEDWTEEEDG